MKKIALATAAAFFASVMTAAAMPGIPMVSGVSDHGVIQVKAKKKMHHMSGMKGGNGMKGMDGMKGGGMKGGGMKAGGKGMKGM